MLQSRLYFESGKLDSLTIAAMRFFRDLFAIDGGALILPGVCGSEGCSVKRGHGGDLPKLLPGPKLRLRPGFPMPRALFGQQKKPYDPLPDLEPGSTFLQVLQWLVDYSEGSISLMSGEAHGALARIMVPDAKRSVVEKNTPFLVAALLEAKKLYNNDMDSTGMLKMALATIAVETSGFVPNNEGVDYKSQYNNSACEDFDVYESYYQYAKDDVASALIQSSRERRMKEKGGAFHAPKRKPHKGSGAVDSNQNEGDGALFKGRGLIQLTHRGSYTQASRDLNLDLDTNPGQLADKDNVELNCRVMVWFLNRGTGPFRDKTYSRVKAALATEDMKSMRQAVNGVSDSPAGLKEFTATFQRGSGLLHHSLAF